MSVSAPPRSGASSLFTSPVLRKVSTGLTGLFLIIYLTQHLLANLRIFSSDPQAVSKYGHTLEGFGLLLRGIEIGLAALIIYHAVMGISIWLKTRKARPVTYKRYQTKGAPSKQTIASRTMFWGGLLMLVFLFIHVAYFRFGPGIAEGYSTMIHGEPARHYERLVTERFEQLGYVVFYCITMVVVGMHISHGFWSATQSLGLVNDRNREVLYKVGIGLGILFTIGFIAIPLGIYFG